MSIYVSCNGIGESATRVHNGRLAVPREAKEYVFNNSVLCYRVLSNRLSSIVSTSEKNEKLLSRPPQDSHEIGRRNVSIARRKIWQSLKSLRLNAGFSAFFFILFCRLTK